MATKVTSNWAGSLDVTRSTNLYDLKDGSKTEGMDYVLSILYKLPTGLLSSKISYSYDIYNHEEGKSYLNDSNLTYSYNETLIYKNQNSVLAGWTPSLTAIIPLSEGSRNNEQLKTALIAGANFKILAGEKTISKGFGSDISVTAGQNFHNYETDVNGKSLNRYSSNQSLAVFYSSRNIFVILNYVNKLRWAYNGELRNGFELSQEVDYSFYKKWTVLLGHTNAGTAFKPNGIDSNVSLISENSSVVYFGLKYIF